MIKFIESIKNILKRIFATRGNGLVLTLLMVTILHLAISKNPSRTIYISPALYLIAVVYTAVSEALVMALASATVVCLFSAYIFFGSFIPFHLTTDSLARYLSFVITTYALAILTAWLKIRNDTAVRRQADLEAEAIIKKRQDEEEQSLKLLTQQHKNSQEEISRSRSEQEIILANVVDGITAQAPDGRIVYANQTAARMIGFKSEQDLMQTPSEQILGRFELFDQYGHPTTAESLPGRQTILSGQPQTAYVGFRTKDNPKIRWSVVKASPIKDSKGKVTMVISIFHDVTQERELEQQQKRQNQRSEFLAKAGEILSSSLDYGTTLQTISQLAVPGIADWASVDVLEEGKIKRLAMAHQDPAKVAWGYELQEKFPVNVNDPSGVPNVIRTGKSEFVPMITQEMIDAVPMTPEQRDILQKLGLSSVMTVPLKILGEPVGAITLVASESGMHFDEEDLNLAEELARRASLAMANSKLFRQAKEQAQNEHEQAALLDTLLKNAPIGFAVVSPNLTYLRVNEYFARLHEMPMEWYIGKTVFELFPEFRDKTSEFYERALREQEPTLGVQMVHQLPSGKIRHWQKSYYPIFGLGGEVSGVGVVVLDTTEQKEAEQKIVHSAYNDSLTGLPNRKFFEETLATLLERAKTTRTKFAVLFLDLDRLKTINDTLGHDIGDNVLREISQRIQQNLRGEDIVSRWGGDEFVVLLSAVKNVHDATMAAQKILKAIEPAMRVSGNVLHVTGSIGIAMFPEDGQDVHSLQKNADSALYRAKAAGKNRYELYNASLNIQAGKLLVLENDLRQAVLDNEFCLYFQPIIDLQSGKVVAVESLLRWQHPRLGLLSPNKFLAIAEEIGLIVTLGEFVFRSSCETSQLLEKEGFSLTVSINISAKQFAEESFIRHMLEIAKETAVNTRRLEVEITESVAMENIDQTRNKLKILKKQGIAVALDDFGTGYSSLNYLRQFPINHLKIDKSFVRHVITNQQDTSIIKAIVSMAGSLNIKTIAEGVDTEMQLSLLRSLGCDAAQGYFISPPLPVSKLLVFLKNPGKAYGSKDLSE